MVISKFRLSHIAVQAAAALAVLCAWSATASAAMVNIAGTDTNINTYLATFRTDVLFDAPTDANPVTATGSVDISGMNTGDSGDNSVLMVGLISKVDFDNAGGSPGDNFFGFGYTDFGSFRYRGNSGFNGALGGRQGNGSAETSLTTFSPAPAEIADGVLNDGDFEIMFGTTQFSLTIGGDSISMLYATGPTFTADFSQGAYAFVGSFLNKTGGSDTYDVTFTGPGSTAPIPLPAALPLFATGLAALGLLGWRRKRKAAA